MNQQIGLLSVFVLFYVSWAQATDLPVGSIKTIKGTVFIERLN